MTEARTELTPSPQSPRMARDYVREVLGAWGCEDPDELAVLLTSELVANAVIHASTRLTVTVRLANGVLRIEVRDANFDLPVVRNPGPEATGGRGMLLVESLAQRWGADVDKAGKVVWFELASRRRQSA